MIAQQSATTRLTDGNGRAARDAAWFGELSGQSPHVAVAKLIEYAMGMMASDVFFSPAEDEVAVTMRRLGLVSHIGRLSREQGLRCATFLRAMAEMKLEERRRPQDGRWSFLASNGRPIDLRISAVPTLHGHSIAVRILDRDSEHRNLDALGLVGPQLETLVSVLEAPSGLILVTGPTGSGKTTTLYTCLDYLNDGSRKIHTLEDPIEYAVRGLQQSQVSEFRGAGFHELLRGVMRQNPDVIMIGEVRDRITAETAVRAANTGQLVFTTLHASVAATAVQIMLSFGVPADFLASALSAIISQRLVRTLAGGSRRKVDRSAASHTFDDVATWLETGEAPIAYSPANGRDLHGGYVGRTGVFEILQITPSIRHMIDVRDPVHTIARKAVEEDMFDFRLAGLLQVAKGVTSFGEIRRVLPSFTTDSKTTAPPAI